MAARAIRRNLASACLVLAVATVCNACGDSNAGDRKIPETLFPRDQDDGYQPGGGMMPTYVPTQDGYETSEPGS